MMALHPKPLDSDDYSHLIVADTRRVPPDEFEDYCEEVLRREVEDRALCGWELPGKYFSRIMWREQAERAPSRQSQPADVCPGCLQAVVDQHLDPDTLCLTPAASWGDWDGCR